MSDHAFWWLFFIGGVGLVIWISIRNGVVFPRENDSDRTSVHPRQTGARFYTACGKPMPVNAAFCPACGQRQG